MLGLKISWPKTELIHVGNGSKPPLVFNGIHVHFVPSFKNVRSKVSINNVFKIKLAAAMQSLMETAVAPKTYIPGDQTFGLYCLTHLCPPVWL